MTIEELKCELEMIISNLTSSGFGSVDSGILEKLDILAAASGELEMKEGKRLIGNLSTTMKAISEGKSKEESGTVRLTALDFYLRKLSLDETTEDL